MSEHFPHFLGYAADGRPREESGTTSAELRNSERTLRTLIDTSPESILLLDTEGTALIVNATAVRRLGKPIDEIIGRKIHVFTTPDVAANRERYVAEVVRTGKPICFDDVRCGRSFENAIHPVFDAQGRVAAVAVLAIDRTDRNRTEQALKQAHDELEQRVEDAPPNLPPPTSNCDRPSRTAGKRRRPCGKAKSNTEPWSRLRPTPY